MTEESGDFDVLSILKSVEATVIEDESPIEWDGTLPEPPYAWMKENFWKVITSVSELRDWWEQLKADVANHVPSVQDILEGTQTIHPKIGFDTETTGLDNRIVDGECKIHIVGLCLAGYHPGGSVYGVVSTPDHKEIPLKQCDGIYIPIAHKRWNWNLDMREVLPLLQEMFTESIIVTHNGKFDFITLQGDGELIAHTAEFCDYTETVLERITIPFPQYPMFEDTQTELFMIDCNRVKAGGGGYGLKQASLDFLDQEQIEFETICSTGVKAKGSRKFILKTFDRVEPFNALHYAAADSICTLQLSDVFAGIRTRVPVVHQIDTNVVNLQAWLEPQRVLIDREYLLDEDRFLKLKCEHVVSQIHEFVGFPMDQGSPTVLGKTLFEEMGLPNKGRTEPSKTFPNGQWSTAKEDMEALAKEHPEIPIFSLIIEYRELRNAYPMKLYEGSDPVDGTAKFAYSATRTPTGRFACSGGEFTRDGGAGLNVQAIQALYGTYNITVQEIDTLALQGYRGLESDSMFDPRLAEWLKQNVRRETPVDYPSGEQISDAVRAENPQISDDGLKIQVKAITNEILASNKQRGYATLKEGLKASTFKGNPTVINGHVKLSPDGWFCALHECNHCFKTPEIDNLPCPKRPLAYDINEVMNLRRAFIAPPGWTFFSVDYGAIELRMVTNLAHEQLWIDGFVGGKDLHASMAEAIFQDKFRNADAKTKSFLRSLAKTITFGNLYGGTPRTIQQHLPGNISMDEAETLYANWIGAIPGYSKWVGEQKAFVDTYHEVYTATGRIRNLERECASRKLIGYAQRTALNHPSQGTAADILRVALIRIKDWLGRNNLEDFVKIHYHVHDEIDFSVKDEWVPYIIPNILRIMQVRDIIDLFNWPVGLDCDVEYGQSWDVKFNYGKKKTYWSGVPGLKMFPQEGFKQLFDDIVEGKDYTVEDYKQTCLKVIYETYRKMGYQDPYRAWCASRQDRLVQKFPTLLARKIH